MNTHKFHATLTALIEMQDSDFDLIEQQMARHYDTTIQSAANIGGWLYGLRNRRNFSNGKDKTMELSMRQIGLILKAFELNNYDQSLIICQRLWHIIKEMDEKQTKINNRLQ